MHGLTWCNEVSRIAEKAPNFLAETTLSGQLEHLQLQSSGKTSS